MNNPIDHLNYELWMLEETYQKATREADLVTRNALIESFCTHARAIFELFEVESKPKKAVHTQGFVPLVDPARFRRILNNQISHLGNERTDDLTLKIDHSKRTEMINQIRDELAGFKACMIDRTKAASIRDVPAMQVDGGALFPSATNAVQTATTTSSPGTVMVSGPVTVKS